MEPFTKTEDELMGMPNEALIGHIRWLYRYIEEIKHAYRQLMAKAGTL